MMFEELFNAMATIMLAKFMLNDLPHAAGLIDNLDEYAHAIVSRLSSKYGVKQPKLSWQPILDTGWLYEYHSKYWIIMSTAWQLAYNADKEGTKRIIPRTIAHEFHHYLHEDDRSIITILSPGREEQARRKRLEAEEKGADTFAYEETGITRQDEESWWNNTVAPVLKKTGWILKTKRRIEERGYILSPKDLGEE